MATVHSRGIAIWGGAGFGKISRFNHPGVQYIDFSPGEKYLVTFSPNQSRGTEGSVIIWEARTGMYFNGRGFFLFKIFENDDNSTGDF